MRLPEDSGDGHIGQEDIGWDFCLLLFTGIYNSYL